MKIHVRDFLGALMLMLTLTAFSFAQNSAAPPADSLATADQAFHAGKFDDALAKYQTVLQQDPKSQEAYCGLARTYLKMEKVQPAAEAAAQALTLAPDSARVHTVAGEVYFRQGKIAESEKEFLAGANNPHPDGRAYLGLHRIYAAYSLHARARTMLQRAHDLAPADTEIQRRWMSTLKLQEQIEWLEKYLAGPINDDAFATSHMRSQLEVLKNLLKQPRSRCRLVSKLTSTEAPLRPMLIDATHLHGFGLEVKVNGHSSRLLLDTGASGLLINKKLAEKAGIQPVTTMLMRGIGDKGDTDGFLGYADSIKIGDLEFQNCAVRVSDKRSVLDDDGLIGADVFSSYLVTIDFLWHKLKLEELPPRPGEERAAVTLSSQQNLQEEEGSSQSKQTDPPGGAGPAADKSDSAKPPEATKPRSVASGPRDAYVAPEMKDYTKIFRFGHELLIPTRVGDSSPKLFLIDTGAAFNNISPDAAREVTKVRSDGRMIVKGISGAVKNVYSADKAVLQFSHFRQENQDLTAFDLSSISHGAGTEVSGILGFTTLRLFTLKIDYRDGLVDFVYAGPKR